MMNNWKINAQRGNDYS